MNDIEWTNPVYRQAWEAGHKVLREIGEKYFTACQGASPETCERLKAQYIRQTEPINEMLFVVYEKGARRFVRIPLDG